MKAPSEAARPSAGARPTAPRRAELDYKIINAHISGGRIFASIGTGIYVSEKFGAGFRLLRDFPGASCGMRRIFLSGRGWLFVSPDGRNVPQDEQGLWRSRDAGATWERTLGPWPCGGVTIWALEEDTRGDLFAGTYTRGGEASLAVVYRSRDGGGSWAPAYADPAGRHIHSIVTDPWRGAVYASVGDDFGRWKTKRVVRSLDGGETWEEILTSMPQTAAALATPTARLFGSDVPGLSQVYRTTDDERVEVVLSDETPLFFFWMRRDPARGDVLLSGVSAGGAEPRARVYRSADDGRSWQVIWEPEAARANDGSAFASNVENSSLIAQVSKGGELQGAILFNLSD